MKKDKAISEIIGAILLVVLVIMGIGIITVVMTSSPPPQSKEKAVLSSSCIDCNGSLFAIVVRHEGGDTIDPRLLDYWLETEYPNGTPFERFHINGTEFYSAEEFSGLSREDICRFQPGSIAYNDTTNMKNGDVTVIKYQMKES